ncbi:AraC family transcriptional regulator [Pseudorhizobium tarimense]|uniref:AraC family transcriptional regulator n=1 Tax=Pseudorhizobium tarimense TaxID=1079109 RepID=A0ABV2HDR0_9HYPH|nr:AraC family transcriptional regulator [Pseudorhizobium tarimense]MCJ8520989.1 AraC family transcriptional regulator [Pseudorhizobium tarimense]MCJ8521030.1 AraC family transcriptional regulator [Pseudorhizobium tarimense]
MENIIVSISPDSFAELAGHELGRSDVNLLPTHVTLDRTALQFAKLIRTELGRHQKANDLCLDSLITLLGIHAIRNYSDAAKPRATGGRGLSERATKRIEEYLRENFRRKLTVAELAGICDLSPGHFADAFTVTFGTSPHQYVLELRMSFAEQLLTNSDKALAEIAFLSGFSSQSHLTSTLRTHRQRTPRQYR